MTTCASTFLVDTDPVRHRSDATAGRERRREASYVSHRSRYNGEMVTDLILGTAGHIDHGKTSLIRALTGAETDRLPEEKRRGITIELGFAELVVGEYRLGVVDVPGHEKFVRQMLAGATGMDVAMLVVAADDSVKQQTREHFEVLRLLDLPAGVIVLTKCDLADPDWIELVEAEVQELVQGTFFEEAPCVRTSSETGDGLDELRSVLELAAAKAAASRSARLDAPFRMAVDRAFTIAGHGTVVTGSISSGSASVGDQLIIEPGAVEVRVRGCQNHDRTVDSVHRGQRAAINLAGIRHDQVRRGHELASNGHLTPSRLLTVEIQQLASSPRPIKNRDRVRLHVGTAEVLASIRLLTSDRLEPGDSGFAQLYLNEPTVTVWRQPMVLRSESPIVTIGGGHVLVPNASKIRKPTETDLQRLRELGSDEPMTRASAALYFWSSGDWTPQDLFRIAGVDDAEAIASQLAEHGDVVEIVASPSRTVRLHRVVLDQWFLRFERALQRLHDDAPLRDMLDRTQLTSRFDYLNDKVLVSALLGQMKVAGRIRLNDKGIKLASHKPKLSPNEKKLLDSIVASYEQAAFQPPTIKECLQIDPKQETRIKKLVDLAAASGLLVHVAGDLFLHTDAERKMREILTEQMADSEGLAISDIRSLLDTSRKYAVPLCEYLDRIGFTKRVGDLRVLA